MLGTGRIKSWKKVKVEVKVKMAELET